MNGLFDGLWLVVASGIGAALSFWIWDRTAKAIRNARDTR